jgi:2-methylcitrate dehydratase PrpD
MTGAARIARFARASAFADLPSEVVEASKLHLLDTLGCGFAAHSAGIGTEAREVSLSAGGQGQSSVIGGGERSASSAALANGTLCHALDFDDTHTGAITHVSTVVCPAALAVAEQHGSSGADLINAIVVGNEVAIRLGEAARPAYMVTGFHPTSVCGIFGAAAAAGLLMNLDETGLESAIGIAGSMAGGLFEYLSDGSATKPLHAGWAAHSAIIAAELAARGATGPSTVLEGRFGVFHAYHRLDGDALAGLSDLGERWETPNISFKPYPACHFIHSPLDAVGLALAEHAPPITEIQAVDVELPEAGVPLVAAPPEAKLKPRTPYDAKFSLQYSIAARLVRGTVDLDSYTADAIREPRVLDLAARVRCGPGEFPTYPGALPGRVAIELRDGSVLSGEVAHERGGPQNPMGSNEVRAKFDANAAQALAPAEREVLATTVLALDAFETVRGAIQLGTSSPSPAARAR